MPLTSKFMKLVAEKISEGLSNEQIEEVILAATGYRLYREYGAPGDPMNLAIYKALDQLTQKGSERWLLTYVLVRAVANDPLRHLIVKVSPESLMPVSSVEAQVQRVIENLTRVRTAALTPEFMEELKGKSSELPAVSRQIATLFAYKSLHECLHALQMQLSHRSTIGAAPGRQARLNDLVDCQKKIELAATKAIKATEKLDSSPDIIGPEHAWIEELKRHATELQLELNAPNANGPDDSPEAAAFLARLDAAVFEDVQSLTRRHLVRLNQRIFDTANELSLEELILAMPELIQAEDYFAQFKHSIRDLNPTVLARTLVHKIWQDVDKEISLIEDVLEIPADGKKRFRDHWMTLRRRVLWLATLEPDAEWSRNATKEAERIDDKVAAEASDQEIRPLFESLRSYAKYRFFAVDDALKKDCDSLGRIDEPIRSMLEEIRNG